VSGDEPVSNRAQNRVGLTRPRQLVAERLSLPPVANSRHSDAEGFQDAADVTLQIHPKSDHSFPGTDQAAEPICGFVANVNGRVSSSAGELRKTFRVSGVRLVQSRRQGRLSLARIDAGRWETQPADTSLKPNR
jgi:hypothetical protein